MTTFDERERGFESHFVMEEELQFKALARRDRMLGEWAGQLLGKSGEELETYVLAVVRSDLTEPGDDDVLEKLVADLAGKADASEIKLKMDALLVEARAAVRATA